MADKEEVIAESRQDKEKSLVPLSFDFSLMLETLNAEREGQLFGEDKKKEIAESKTLDIGDIMKTYIKENGIANFLGKMNEVVRLQGYHFVENEVEQNFSGKRIKF